MDCILIVKILILPLKGGGDFANGRPLNQSILLFLLFNSITLFKHIKLGTGIVNNYLKIWVDIIDDVAVYPRQKIIVPKQLCTTSWHTARSVCPNAVRST